MNFFLDELAGQQQWLGTVAEARQRGFCVCSHSNVLDGLVNPDLSSLMPTPSATVLGCCRPMVSNMHCKFVIILQISYCRQPYISCMLD